MSRTTAQQINRPARIGREFEAARFSHGDIALVHAGRENFESAVSGWAAPAQFTETVARAANG